jgi:hypothetical protein
MFKKSLIVAIAVICFNTSQCHDVQWPNENQAKQASCETLKKEKLAIFKKDLEKVNEQEEILLNSSSTQLSHSKICFYAFLAGLGLVTTSFLVADKDINGRGDGLFKAGAGLVVASLPAGAFTSYTEKNKLTHCEKTRHVIYKNINDLQ